MFFNNDKTPSIDVSDLMDEITSLTDHVDRCNDLHNKRLSSLEGSAFSLGAGINELKSDNELMNIKIKKLEDRLQFVFDLLIGLIIVIIAAVIIYITMIH